MVCTPNVLIKAALLRIQTNYLFSRKSGIKEIVVIPKLKGPAINWDLKKMSTNPIKKDIIRLTLIKQYSLKKTNVRVYDSEIKFSIIFINKLIKLSREFKFYKNNSLDKKYQRLMNKMDFKNSINYIYKCINNAELENNLAKKKQEIGRILEMCKPFIPYIIKIIYKKDQREKNLEEIIIQSKKILEDLN